MAHMTPDEIQQAFDESTQGGAHPTGTAWIPEKEGETLIGFMVRRNMREGEYGSYPVITVITAEGDVRTLHCTGSRLAGNLDHGGDWPGLIAEHDPQPGDLVGFRYDGRGPSKKKGQQGAHQWAMFVRRAPQDGQQAAYETAAQRISASDDADEYSIRWAKQILEPNTAPAELGSDDPFDDTTF